MSYVNERAIYPYYQKLNHLVMSDKLVTDKTGKKVAELIAPQIKLDPRYKPLKFVGRNSPKEYIRKESEWYQSYDLNIEKVKDTKIWRDIADENGEVNSNYGYLTHSRGNFSQLSNVIKTLKEHKESRQGIIIYTRPSIHYEASALNCSDFICTNFQHVLLRNDKLITITSQRSADCIFGTFNDLPFFHSVIQEVYEALLPVYPDLELGDHIFIPNSFHVYERHFKLLNEIVERNKRFAS